MFDRLYGATSSLRLSPAAFYYTAVAPRQTRPSEPAESGSPSVRVDMVSSTAEAEYYALSSVYVRVIKMRFPSSPSAVPYARVGVALMNLLAIKIVEMYCTKKTVGITKIHVPKKKKKNVLPLEIVKYQI